MYVNCCNLLSYNFLYEGLIGFAGMPLFLSTFMRERSGMLLFTVGYCGTFVF
jgi:hypothetical protein